VARPSRYGLELARVMDWYWDGEGGKEVCYMEDGGGSICAMTARAGCIRFRILRG